MRKKKVYQIVRKPDRHLGEKAQGATREGRPSLEKNVRGNFELRAPTRTTV